MKTKLRCMFIVLALIAGVHQAVAQGTRFFRISGPATTSIIAFNSDGTLVWSNKDDVARIARGRLSVPSTIFDSTGFVGCDEFKLIAPTTTLFWRHMGFFTKFDIKGGDEQGTWMADFAIQVASTIVEPTS